MKNSKSKFLGMVGTVAAALLSIMPGVKQAGNMPTMVNSQNRIASNAKQKSTAIQAPQQRNTIVNEIGGIPFASVFPNYGMSPKEYGMRYGNGGSKKINRLRCAHNAKVKRRNAC